MKYSHAVVVACIVAPHLISAAPHFLSRRDVDDSGIRTRAPTNGGHPSPELTTTSTTPSKIEGPLGRSDDGKKGDESLRIHGTDSGTDRTSRPIHSYSDAARKKTPSRGATRKPTFVRNPVTKENTLVALPISSKTYDEYRPEFRRQSPSSQEVEEAGSLWPKYMFEPQNTKPSSASHAPFSYIKSRGLALEELD